MKAGPLDAPLPTLPDPSARSPSTRRHRKPGSPPSHGMCLAEDPLYEPPDEDDGKSTSLHLLYAVSRHRGPPKGKPACRSQWGAVTIRAQDEFGKACAHLVHTQNGLRNVR